MAEIRINRVVCMDKTLESGSRQFASLDIQLDGVISLESCTLCVRRGTNWLHLYLPKGVHVEPALRNRIILAIVAAMAALGHRLPENIDMPANAGTPAGLTSDIANGANNA